MLVQSITSGQPSLNVTWTPPSSDQAILYYEVEYKVSTSDSWTSQTPNPTAISTVLEGLQIGISYKVRVRAVSELGNGTWSSEAEKPTFNIPRPPTELSLQRTLDSNNPAFAVTWVRSSTSGSPILHYEVQYRVSGTASWSALSSNPTTTSATLSSLQTGTSYQVRVRAISEIGSGNWSDYVSETTYNAVSYTHLTLPTKRIV